MLGKCPSCRSLTVLGPDGRCPNCGHAMTGDPESRGSLSGGGPSSAGSPQPEHSWQPDLAGEVREAPPYPASLLGVPPEALAMAQFRQNILRLTPHTYVTRLLVGANVLVFVVMVLSGVNPLMPRVDQLVAWGANFGPLTQDGQAWRLVTCMFLHVGLIHLLFNMWVLWQIGALVERLLGNVGLFVAYMISGVGGSLVSLYWHPNVVSAGASGAVFGMFGALLGFLVFSRHSIPLQALRSLAQSSIMFVVFNVAFGLAVPGIDMAAHLGGLATGLFCGLGLSQPINADTGRRRLLRNVLVAVGGTGVLAAAIGMLPSPDTTQLLGTTEAVEMRLRSELSAATQRHQDGQLNDRELADWIERETLPAWRALRARVEQSAAASSDQERARLLAKARQLRLQEQQFQILAARLRAN